VAIAYGRRMPFFKITRRAVLSAAAAIPTLGLSGLPDLQDRMDYVSRNGGAPIELPPGDVGIDRTLILPPGVVVRGAPGRLTRLIATRPSMRVFDRHGGPPAGKSGLERITVVGFGDRLKSRGDERDRTVVLGPFQTGWCRNVEVAHSRWVSLTGSGVEFEVSDCYVHHGYRDGIQLNSVFSASVLRNVIDRVADDGIACHVGKGFVPSAGRSIQIIGNKLSRCTGIKCLGASSAVIQKNRTSLVYGYAVFLGVDSNFGEGLAQERNVKVIDNEFLDTLGLSEIGLGRGVAVVYVAGGNAALKTNDGLPITQSDILVSRNIIRQTLAAPSRHLDLWWVDGPFQKGLRTDRYGDGGAFLRGVMFDGGILDGVRVEENTIEGFAEPVLFQRNVSIRRADVRRNRISHCARPITAPKSVEVDT